MTRARFRDYRPHRGQQAFHYAIDNVKRFVAMVCGIRGGKTWAGARQAHRMAWNSHADGVFAIVAPSFKMLRKTTWRDYKKAAYPWIEGEDKTNFIIRLKNGREVFGFSAEDPDNIRNQTVSDFWIDEARQCKDFANLWDVMMGRVLSTGGRGIVTTSPNGFDDIHNIFVDKKDRDYMLLRFSTYENIYIPKEAIDSLARKYDKKFADQEIGGQFVVFEGQVYYTFNRFKNAGDIAYKVAQYDPKLPICLCCDFNVDPMAWVVAQIHEKTKQKPNSKETEIYRDICFIDEIFIRNSNTPQCCDEFKTRFPNHKAGLRLYGDATGAARNTSSNITNWKIIERELQGYGIIKRVPSKNPAEKDRINAFNGMICNSKNERFVFINPKTCKNLIKDLEQVPYKEGSAKIDKTKNILLTHISDAAGYMIEQEFSLNKGRIEGLRI